MGSGSNPISDVLNTVTKTVSDVGMELNKVAHGKINLDPNVKAKQEAKDQELLDQQQREAAAAKQTADKAAQVKVKAANAEAGAGSSIILGSKRKKSKGSSVSSGMGLSKGATGLQT